MITRFPRPWLWLVDETIPVRVKKIYSPRESWKEKPFSKEDAHFFFKGIEELSALFTEERPKGMPAYFSHPKYRSAYLLYFLPLQAAKFLTLFEIHRPAMDALIQSASNSGVLRIADFGAGPGTASISLLLYLLDRMTETSQNPTVQMSQNRTSKASTELPQIEFYWFDTQESIMADGKALVDQISSQFPKLRGRVQVHLSTAKKNHLGFSSLPENLSMVLMGHVLNETPSPQQQNLAFWKNLIDRTQGGGILMVEPAGRKTSQQLSNLRNFFIQSGLIEKTPQSIWGPCLHAEACPLAEGRDWCHFSVPLEIPGKWFKEFSRGLGSERQWVKYSYLWLASNSYSAPKPHPQLRRVVSDPLIPPGMRNRVSENRHMTKSTVLLCEPETVARWTISGKDRIQRGDLITVRNQHKARR